MPTQLFSDNDNSIKTETISLIRFFEDNNLFIPTYQRKYEWGDEEWLKFIETIFIDDQSNSYMGSIIVCSRQDKNIESVEVIDGQQRTTTLFIFLLYFYSKFKKELDNIPENTKKEFYAFFALFESKNLNFLKIGTDKENSLLLDLINSVNENNVNIRSTNRYNKCFNFFKSYEDFKNISFDVFINYLKKCFLVFINTNDLSEAINIFITMNTTGVDLKYADIIKSKLLEVAEISSNFSLKEKIVIIWEEVINNSTFKKQGDKIDDFLAFYLECTSVPALSKKKILKNYISLINDNKSDILSFLNGIKDYSDIYKNIHNPIDEYWSKFYEIVFSIKELNYRSMFPLLGYIKKNNKINQAEYLKFLNDVFVANFRMLTLKKGYGTRTRNFILSCKKYLFNNTLDLLYKDDAYIKELNGNDDYRSILLNFSFPYKDHINGVAKFLLRKVYNNLSETKIFNAFNDKFTLEHILDKKAKISNFNFDNSEINEKWINEWRDELEKSDENRDYICSLGNLTLLNDTDNQNASSSNSFNWIQKKKIYWGNNEDKSVSLFNLEKGCPFNKELDFLSKDLIDQRKQYLVNQIIESNILKINSN